MQTQQPPELRQERSGPSTTKVVLIIVVAVVALAVVVGATVLFMPRGSDDAAVTTIAATGATPTADAAATDADRAACRNFLDHTDEFVSDPVAVITTTRDSAEGEIRPLAQRMLDARLRLDAVGSGQVPMDAVRAAAESAAEEWSNAMTAFAEACGKILH